MRCWSPRATSDRRRAILASGALRDDDAQVRLAALLALAEMPASEAVAASLVEALLAGTGRGRPLAGRRGRHRRRGARPGVPEGPGGPEARPAGGRIGPRGRRAGRRASCPRGAVGLDRLDPGRAGGGRRRVAEAVDRRPGPGLARGAPGQLDAAIGGDAGPLAAAARPRGEGGTGRPGQPLGGQGARAVHGRDRRVAPGDRPATSRSPTRPGSTRPGSSSSSARRTRTRPASCSP